MQNLKICVLFLGVFCSPIVFGQTPAADPAQGPSSTPANPLAALRAQSNAVDRSAAQIQASTRDNVSALQALRTQSAAIDAQIANNAQAEAESACATLARETLRSVLNDRDQLVRNTFAPKIVSQRQLLNRVLSHLARTPEEISVLRQTVSILSRAMQIGNFPESLQTYQGVNVQLILQALQRYSTGERIRGTTPPAPLQGQSIDQIRSNNALWSVTSVFSQPNINPLTPERLNEMVAAYTLISEQIARFYDLFGVRALQLVQTFENTSRCQEASTEAPQASISEIVSVRGQNVFGLTMGSREQAFRNIFDEFYRQPVSNDPARFVRNSRPQYFCGENRLSPVSVNTLRFVVELPTAQKPNGGFYAVACGFDRTAFLNIQDSSDTNFACSEIDLFADNANTGNLPTVVTNSDVLNAINYANGIQSGIQHGALNPEREVRHRLLERFANEQEALIARNPQLESCPARVRQGDWIDNLVRSAMASRTR